MSESREILKLVVAGNWRVIPGRPFYEVSDLGQVRNAETKRILMPFLNERGYLRVALEYGLKERIGVHRLVLETFVGPCPEGMECAHLNGVRTDNRLANLAWVTPEENARHKLIHGTRYRPRVRTDQCGVVKVDEQTVREIRAKYQEFNPKRGRAMDNRLEIAKEYGLCVSNIMKIVRRQTWKDVV